MFAEFGTGGIPGSGSDRSATGLATCQLSAALGAERTGASLPALGWSARAGAGTAECDVGHKIITPPAITATTATATPPDRTLRRARWPAGQPTLPMPILPARPCRAALVPVLVPAESENNAGDAYPLPDTAGDYTQAKAVNHSPFGPKLPGVATEREDDLEYLMAFVDAPGRLKLRLLGAQARTADPAPEICATS
jgi:hypothetical protein